jgi:hypothetical protein
MLSTPTNAFRVSPIARDMISRDFMCTYLFVPDFLENISFSKSQANIAYTVS